MKNFFTEIKISFFIVVISVIFGWLCIAAVKSIPNGCIEKNIETTAQILKTETNNACLYVKGSFLDNFSDADAIAVMYNNKEKNPFYNALYCYNYYIGRGNIRGVDALYKTITKNVNENQIYEHSQEWHGYQLWLKPALIFMDISDIRLICFLMTQLLFVLVCIELSKVSKNSYEFLPFFISFEYYNLSLESISFIFCMDICTMLAGCLGIIYAYRKNLNVKYFSYIFVLVGISAAYFSMFTLPLITVGFNLILWQSLPKREFEEKKRIYFTVKYFFYWCVGYFGMGLTKLISAIILFKAKNGIYGIKWYLGIVKDVSLSYRFKNIAYYISNIANGSEFRYYFLAAIIFVMLIYVIVKNIVRKEKVYISFDKYIPYILVGLQPLLWVFIVSIHIKCWVIFLFSVSIYAFLQFLWDICKE